MLQVAVWGVGGHGREVMPLIKAQFENKPDVHLSFVDDSPPENRVNGYDVFGFEQWLRLPASNRKISIAIGNSRVREGLANRCAEFDIGFVDVFAANAICLDSVKIGPGAIISPFVALTSNVIIGKQFHANTHCSVAHDCVIGDYVTFAPGVRCNGNVIIGDHAYIGSGVTIKQGTAERPLVIGRGAVVGMGSVVTKDVAPGATVVGNPARLMQKF